MLNHTRSLNMGTRLVVVGFGMVGYKVIERLSALGALDYYDVTVIGEEPHLAYDRVRLTEWFDHRDSQRLALGRPGWSESLGIRVITGTAVVSIDREHRTVETADAEQIVYDHLVLATGSRPFVPPIEGVQHDGVFVYRTIDDLDRIGRRAGEVNTAIVVGGGLLGIEAADAFRRLGLQIVLLESGPCLMSRQLGSDGAALLGAQVREMGVQTIVGARARRIEARQGQLILSIDSQAQPLAADMIVMTAGIRPRDGLARDCGLAVASGRGGIIIDDKLCTTDPAIYAIGECASHNGMVYGLVAPGFRMAETLAEILAGHPGRFRGYTPAVRLRLSGIEVWSLGDHAQPGTRVRWRGNGSYRQITLRGRQMVAASSVGPWDEIGFVQDIIRTGHYISPEQLQRFHQTGMFSNRTVRRPVAEWPASAMVCNCLEITRGALSFACARGCSSLEALVESTDASTVCGFCRPLLRELVGDTSAVVEQEGRTGLLVTAVIAAVLAIVMVTGSPIPLATSVQSSSLWDILYRDSWWRQATGFALLGCALVAAGFSLRKRWRRVAWGRLGWWRLGHGAIAVLALIALIAHTGMRLGSGFNQVLMISFLSASVFGTAAAVGMGRRHARLMFWLHLLAVWPLPVLIVFHILSSYYF